MLLKIKSSVLDTARASAVDGSLGTAPLKLLSRDELGPVSSQPEFPESRATPGTWDVLAVMERLILCRKTARRTALGDRNLSIA